MSVYVLSWKDFVIWADATGDSRRRFNVDCAPAWGSETHDDVCVKGSLASNASKSSIKDTAFDAIM